MGHLNIEFMKILSFQDAMTFNVMVFREQLILECMIANLFEEYRFFPKYPERQLKIAAVLFGEL